MKISSIIPILIMYMLFASTFTIGKVVLALVNPVFFIGVRMTIAGLLLLGYSAFVQKKPIRVAREHYWLFALIALFHVYIAYIAEFWALQYVLSAKACLLYNLSPFITALCTYGFYKETLSYKKISGLFIGFLGFIPILLSSAPQELAAGHWGFLSFPELMLFVSVLSSVWGWLIFKNLITKHRYSPFLINGHGMLVGGLMALVTSFFIEGTPFIGARGSSHEIFLFIEYTALMIIVANIIGYNLYGHLLHIYSPTLLSFFGFTTPLFAAFYGFIFLNEPISVAFIISVITVSIGLFLFYQEELRENSL
jgi:drug/metabolite transporter (DMT)-like permease